MLIGVECNSFCSSVHLHYATNHLSLYFFLWCITPDYRCLVDGYVILPTFLLPWFLPLSSLSSHSHVCYLWLIVMSSFCHFCSTLTLLIDCHVNFPPFLSSLHSHFVDCCVTFFQSTLLDTLTFPLFLCTLMGTALGKHGSLLLIID